jgi:hypothetical protein
MTQYIIIYIESVFILSTYSLSIKSISLLILVLELFSTKMVHH